MKTITNKFNQIIEIIDTNELTLTQKELILETAITFLKGKNKNKGRFMYEI